MKSNPDSVEAYDFRIPRRLLATSRQTLERWLIVGCTQTAERWRHLNLDVSLSHVETRTLSLDIALKSLADPGWGMQAAVGVRSFPTIMASQPGWLRVLASRLLGEDQASDQTHAPLTAIEESMAELLFQELTTALSEAWPGAEPLDIRLGEAIRRPQRTRLFAPRTTLTVVTFQIESDGHSGNLVWVLPQSEIEDLIEIECTLPDAPRVTPNSDIPWFVRGMTVPLTVELGRLTLSMTELTSLQTGDVIVLDQSPSSLLMARIGGAMKFRGRPGHMGNRRCLEIEQVLNNNPLLSSDMSHV
ncbi:MAG: FliM/FliN family flagellar motor switch protein [Planctomycetaceae bacterium]|nr:FliM/FliN family flagellar motor switch protein [Planctomycetaceae bacterium]